MFNKILIANRGAIACRILRTVKSMGPRSVAVYSEADENSPHVRLADEAFAIGPAPAAESYLRGDRILEAARLSGAEAIHPGYGFLSENAEFAQSCEDAGIVFIGPTPSQMRDFGLKHTARELAQRCGLPLLPGTELLADLPAALEAAVRIGYPVMLKSTAGGGGIGMRRCNSAAELGDSFAAVQRLAAGNFKNAGVFLEKFVARARHIEVQLFGDGRGNVIALGERDCSVQRRNQKVIEESPAPGLDHVTRTALHEAAVKLGEAVNYRSAGTVEFVYDAEAAQFYFLEVNTRLQVEHGVTEEVGGVDLVEWMIRTAAGEPPDLRAHWHVAVGHAIQARVYAEDPARHFRPASGLLTQVKLPDDVRVDAWIEAGTEVTAFYDPMLAKIIARGATRELAIARLKGALQAARIDGIETNLPYLVSVLEHPVFIAGEQTTALLASHVLAQPGLEILAAGTLTTVQDWPGRLGLWDVGVPPSGPMDSLALRRANCMVGNEEGAAALEMTVSGATMRFNSDAVVALAGAAMDATIDGRAVPFWEPLPVKLGSVLAIGRIRGAGQRAYLAVRGGFDIPEYLGSRATFTLGRFGGHGGRALRAGDVLRLNRSGLDLAGCSATPSSARPEYSHAWQIAVTDGPHGAPDFFTPDDLRAFFDAQWEVHYNSSRTGVRLIGPKPAWARRDGGEAGLHPSNIHDNAYAIGSVDFTGDMPVILGPDGPSLGGFVCPVTIVNDELWKIGQLRPGDKVQFRRVGQVIRDDNPSILLEQPASANHAAICVRRSGESNLLVEFGAPVLDLVLRFQVQALLEELRKHDIPGLLDLTPGIRSLQIHFDPARVTQQRVLDGALAAIAKLPSVEAMRLPSRIVHLPLSWDDPATQAATKRYEAVRADAPWCPDNIEFIRRINGLDSREAVRDIVFGASYLVMGLGDVYLGAPVATPLDPRHRLVTTKYNPARTWTPENAVGIGGAYLCVYGMEGPGGYQFVGRTVQMWNRYQQTCDFRDGKQWVLRFFDQIRFYPVSSDELLKMRAGFPYGRHPLRIEETQLDLGEYLGFLESQKESIDAFRHRQRGAFEAERERWRAAGVAETPIVESPPKPDAPALPADCIAITSPVSGSVWQMKVAAGQSVEKGDTLVIMEAMKMEIAVLAESAGLVHSIHGVAGAAAQAGDTLLVVKPVLS
ncbi:MAG TPA: 5-oxoprolinase/urea amidolyase family protein [Steroidobacteraceae bacterium]|jgi:urea carboxylase|nr:5-oxoprolinase/urea amidolyase family protein [Steroidobacteraceae bacterium]